MAKKVFKGRVICSGSYEGECVVSHQGLNTLATFQKSALKNAKKLLDLTKTIQIFMEKF